MRGKANELLSQLYPTFPHILCLSEHHMNHSELQQPFFDNYKLGVSYCRTLYEKGGVSKYFKGNSPGISGVKIQFVKPKLFA